MILDLVERTGLENPSVYQKEIFRFIDSEITNYINGLTPRNLAVSAVAGAGKTTVAVAAANLIPSKLQTVFLAFNKSIADELALRLPRHVESRTLNSLGHSILMPYLNGIDATPINVSTYRTQKIMRGILSKHEMDKCYKHVKFLVSMCKSLGVVPVGVTDGCGVGGRTATESVLRDICLNNFHYINAGLRDRVYELTNLVLAESFSDQNLYKTNTIDFDDQKWLSVCKRPNGAKIANANYDVVFIDEVQDLNPVALELIKMIVKPDGMIVGIGDPNQSILGFAGSDPRAYYNFVSSFKCEELPLSITYRCAKSLTKNAAELVPEIKPRDDAPEGKVDFLEDWDASVFQPSDMVLCRMNAPLLKLAFKLVANNTPVLVKGKSIGRRLVSIIEDCVGITQWIKNPKYPTRKMKVVSTDGIPISRIVPAVNGWAHEQIDMIMTEFNGSEARIQSIHDIKECIITFVDNNPNVKDTSELIDIIENMFTDEDTDRVVMCSTIHKAKGLEAERVFLYRPDLMYPVWVDRKTWMYVQEQNLDYIARTRGKTYYAVLNNEDENG